MASTKFQVGLSEEQAGNKRAQNPRGHAHTDIFGISDQVQPSQKKNLPTSNIKNILMDDEQDGKEDKEIKEIKNTNGTNKDTNGTKQVNENKTENNVQFPTPQRVRMPPGGFSSGLW